ncbi:M23 family metallopeptidase [Kitasatospora sp. NBC_01266]|uniref:M23 family metallopeptidase n=1 Tax=Kitasatospora sp. NBC_01266 TaxID=2903572 RepID=UPI002E33ADEC|nr:M23 family metallopeptidase [Kitasatospora sp. NBC_01266]
MKAVQALEPAKALQTFGETCEETFEAAKARCTTLRVRLGRGRHARPRLVRRLALPEVALPDVDLYAVFRGPHRRTAITSALAGAALLGVALSAVPGSAVAQTVHPTTPGSSEFSLAHGRVPFDNLVQVADPSAYQLPHGAPSSQQAVAVAGNLAGPAEPEHPAPPAPPARPDWSAPAPGAPISNGYGHPDPGYAAGYHTGVDFAVNEGTPLLAVGKGSVVSSGRAGAYGNQVVLKLADGRFAQYAHLSRLDVSAGDQVTAGQQIGAAGSTGNATGPHLHFEIRTANTYGAVIDPVAYLRAHGVTGL